MFSLGVSMGRPRPACKSLARARSYAPRIVCIAHWHSLVRLSLCARACYDRDCVAESPSQRMRTCYCLFVCGPWPDGGASSCQWEVGTAPRSEPTFDSEYIGAEILGPDDAALFKVDVGNSIDYYSAGPNSKWRPGWTVQQRCICLCTRPAFVWRRCTCAQAQPATCAAVLHCICWHARLLHIFGPWGAATQRATCQT